MSNNSIKFDVPYNGDGKLIDFYISHKDHIDMVYGRAEDGYPQGRKTDNGKFISFKDLFKHNAKLLKHGIKFNYLLNGTSHGNQEYDKDYRNKFLNHVRYLKDNGIKMVTIGNLLLLEAVINEIPGIEVAASILLETDSLVKLKTIHKLGVNCVFLSKVLLKNFNALKKIHEFNLKNPNLKLFLLANDPCVNHCIYTNYHNETLSLLTGNNKQCNSFCRMQCTRRFANDTSSIISASFIRPEDLHIYNAIGFNLIKLCDRKQTTERIKKMFDAYINQYYDGYISDIMAPWSRHQGVYPELRQLNEIDVSNVGIEKFRDFLRFSPKINNRDLDGYLDFWLKNRPNGCANEDCDSCGYCKAIASRLLKINFGVLKNNLNVGIKACFK